MAPITTRNDPYAVHNNKTELQYGSDNKFVAGSISNDDLDKALGNYVEEDILEPIAIVGFSLKFPQEATTPEAFWKMLVEKRCSMTEWPKERLNVDVFYHPDSSRSDTIPFRGGHFVEEDLGNFDAPFFSITPVEAAAIDPQQRILLETAYRALENAGVPLEKASGSKTSVHTGCCSDDYKMALIKDTDLMPKHTATGIANSVLAGRLSWFFDLTGPCFNVDSACSSSMIAFDLACQGLRSRDADMALVAGANLAITLDSSLPLSNMNFISHDSRCFSFDDRANGYGRGEGVGVLVLKRLVDALSDGDTIRAVVRSTGSSQDGRTPGITQPSKEAQERLIRETYEKAGLDMQMTRYVEAHGTGTMIGDPIEAGALGTAFRKHRSPENPLYIGTVKSNIGHLEGASGIAGIIKTILVLESGIIPPNANFERVNPRIDAEFLSINFPLKNTAWPCKGLRRASIASSGFGGSNSHAILDDAYNFLRTRNLTGNHSTAKEPPAYDVLRQSPETLTSLAFTQNVSLQASKDDRQNLTPKLLVWSAADEGGIARLVTVYNSHMARLASTLSVSEASAYLKSLAYTLAVRRSSLSWKSFTVASSVQELQELASKMSKPVRSIRNPKLGYIFTGQGAQFAGMAKELLEFQVFLNSLRKSEMYLEQLGCQWSLMGELVKDKEASRINDPAYSQPICTALQIALVDLLRSFKIIPSAVIGHSSGEIAAAYCVGGLSRHSACKVAFFRGQYAAQLSESSDYRGAMISVGLSEDDLKPYLDQVSLRFQNQDIIAGCINSPKNVTVTGDEAQVQMLASLLEKDKIFARRLQVNVAYHSPQMNQIAGDYLLSIESLQRGDVPIDTCTMISSVTGQMISLTEMQESAYWVKNMTSPVRFSDALTQLCPAATSTSRRKLWPEDATVLLDDLLEIGPHCALKGPIREHLVARGIKDISYRSTLIRSVPAMHALLDAVGSLHCSGYAVDIPEVNRSAETPHDGQMVLPQLPHYPFDHSKSYWHESRFTKNGWRLRKYPRLDLLGSPAPDWNPLHATWRNIIRLSETPWAKDHKVNETIVYPAAGMLVMALEACKQMADMTRPISAYVIKDATFRSALTIAAGSEEVETQIQLRPLEDSSSKDSVISDFRISMNNDGHWSENCRGTVQVEYEVSQTEVDAGKEAKARSDKHRGLFEEALINCDQSVNTKELYMHMQNIGLGYGPAFQALKQASYSRGGEAVGKVRAFQWAATQNANHPQSHIIHPTSLDASLHLMIVALSKGIEENQSIMMTTHIGRLWIASSGISYPSTPEVNVYARANFLGIRKADAYLFALDQTTGDLLLSIENTEATIVATRDDRSPSRSDTNRLCYNMIWKPDLDLMDVPQIVSYCERSRPDRASATGFYEDLGLLLLMFMSSTLDTLVEENCRSSEPHLQRYIQWLRHQVDRFRSGKLPSLTPDDPRWTSIVQDPEYREALCHQLETSAQGRFFTRIGRNLPRILKGDLDALSFMFEGEFIPEFYREINSKVICYEPFNRYLGLMSHSNPGLKVLEIGAGIGATTDYVLDALSTGGDRKTGTLSCAQYDYTDISPAFFEAARERFKDSGKLGFKVLDIERDVSSQGFQKGTYDLVIAASVLHATKNLEVTMHNARSLLKTGGKFVIFEVTQDVLRAGFAFGLLPGWWLSEEDYRRWGPCISATEWHNLMSKTGFSGADVEIPDFLDQACHEYSIIISTAVKLCQDPGSGPSDHQLQLSKKPSIIVTEDSSMQQDLGTELKDRLGSTGKADCDILSLEQAAKAQDLSQRFCIFLIEVKNFSLVDLDARSFANLQHVLTNIPGLLWVTSGGDRLEDSPELYLIDGLARVVRTEFNKLVFVTLALEEATGGARSLGHKIHQVFEMIMSQPSDDFEPEYKERDGIIEVSRLIQAGDLNEEIRVKTQKCKSRIQEFGHGPPLSLNVGAPGLLNSLHFLEDLMPRKPLAPGEIEIEVKAAGANFRDCLTALGQIDTKILGTECSGIVSRIGECCEFKKGDHVTALFVNTFSTYARGPAHCARQIPDGMSFAEASALPVIFITAWYALSDVARLQHGETVLIHAGAGGTGQAAIQVAKHIGADIYVTVGSNEKRSLVMTEYDIPEDHIFYSRNQSFAQGIMRMTDNRGVDVVLNSLSGAGLIASWECIAPFGRFIEIGKKDINSHSSLPMWQFNKNATFSSADLYPLMQERPSTIHRLLGEIIALLSAKKLRVPQPFRVFGVHEIEDAFRLFQSGQNSGKMAIEMRKKDPVNTVLDTKPDYQFGSEASYLIAGGLGGLGRSAARWMVSRGAKNLILISRSGPRSAPALALVEELQSQGVYVKALACDVTRQDSLTTMLSDCADTMPPIKGVVQGSMVLRDAIFENMTIEDWKLSIAPKVKGSWNLHSLLPRGMDFFICLSSVSGIIGGGGQANYAAANSFMDALVQYRLKRGEKATALDLGWMESEGVAAENAFLSSSLAATGSLIPISPSQFHALLDHFCNPSLDVAPPVLGQAVIGLDVPAAMQAKGMKEPHWMQRRTSRHLHLIGLDEPSSAASEEAVDYAALFRNAASLEDAGRVVKEGLVQKLSRSLSILPEDMDTSKALHTYGVDSLLAVELRNYFAKEMDADMAVFDIMGSSSIESVSMVVARKSGLRQASWTKTKD